MFRLVLFWVLCSRCLCWLLVCLVAWVFDVLVLNGCVCVYCDAGVLVFWVIMITGLGGLRTK